MDQPSRYLLGQVFTPPAVAELIASLCIHRSDATVFDPCVGEGALLLAAGRRLAALGAGEWHQQVRGMELDPRALAVGRGRLAAAAAVTPDQIGVVPGDFLATLAGDAAERTGGGFSVAVMNPPYTRQELLREEWKVGGADAPGLSRRGGLHVRFWMHLARFVRPGGWLGAITSATWLSADFGRGLRAFLLEHFRVHLLIDFERDVFPDANVEACVAILEKRSGVDDAAVRAQNRVRFVRLKRGADLLGAVESARASDDSVEEAAYRLRIVPQAQLAAEQRWNRFFAAPEWHTPGVRVSAPTVPLAALARIRRGITTGNNRVFLPDAESIARFGIEKEHLRSLVKSPRDIPGLDTDTVPRPSLLLVPPEAGADESGAAAYLKAQGVSGSSYFSAALPAPAPLLFGYALRTRKAFFRNSSGLLAGDNFLCLTPRCAEDLGVLFALLNALPTAFHLEMQGRGQGRGLLKVQRYELAELRLPDLGQLDSGLRRELEILGERLWRAPDDAAVRAALDAAACRAIGMSEDAVRRAERAAMQARQARRSAPAPAEAPLL